MASSAGVFTARIASAYTEVHGKRTQSVAPPHAVLKGLASRAHVAGKKVQLRASQDVATGPMSKRASSSKKVFAAQATEVNLGAFNKSGEPLRVIVVGAPGSGKGTQCKIISDNLGLVHISAGDVLREAAAAGTPMGLRAKECMDRGELVPTDVAVTLVKERLEQDDCKTGWILDGYPRSQSQYEGLSAAGIEPELVVLLDVPDNKIVDRIIGRRQDPVSGKIYHLTYSPPENEEIASRLVQRSDDTEEAVRTRLRVHHENVGIVRAAYKAVLKEVDGDRDTTKIYKDLETLLVALRE
eukprot:2580706-Pyramimonas_sp.AAC.2